jgi:predicted helicase
LVERYGLTNNRDWDLKVARAAVQKDSGWRDKLAACAYRPFDTRWSYFSEVAMDYPRRELIDHVAGKANLCLGVGRQGLAVQDPIWSLVTCSNHPVDANIFRRGGINICPVYLYPTAKTSLFDDAPSTAPSGRRPNFAPEFIADCARITGTKWLPDGQGSVSANTESAKKSNTHTFGPEDIFYYAYAVFYSPGYRARYAQFLKTDFPRLPLTSQRPLFAKLITLGKLLVDLHLMRRNAPSVCSYPIAGDNKVEKVSFEADSPTAEVGKVCINANQYFANVPRAVWAYQIGGYQVAHKWLKDRKSRLLTFEDLQHYSQVLAALASTMALQTEIDAAIDAAGGWPMNK